MQLKADVRPVRDVGLSGGCQCYVVAGCCVVLGVWVSPLCPGIVQWWLSCDGGFQARSWSLGDRGRTVPRVMGGKEVVLAGALGMEFRPTLLRWERLVGCV